MPRLFKSHYKADEPDREPNAPREYHKHDTEYWDRPSLAKMIQEYVNDRSTSYDELRDWALSQGYAITSFYQTMSALRDEGKIAQSTETREYTGADWI